MKPRRNDFVWVKWAGITGKEMGIVIATGIKGGEKTSEIYFPDRLKRTRERINNSQIEIRAMDFTLTE